MIYQSENTSAESESKLFLEATSVPTISNMWHLSFYKTAPDVKYFFARNLRVFLRIKWMGFLPSVMLPSTSAALVARLLLSCCWCSGWIFFPLDEKKFRAENLNKNQ